MRQFAKTLTKGAVKSGLLSLIACTCIHMSFATNSPSEPALSTAPDVEAVGMVLNDQYKFTQTNASPFIIDQFSAFDYTDYSVYKVYVHTVNQTDFVHRIFGNTDYPATISAPGGIYNNSFCIGATSGGVPPPGFFYGGYNAHEIDSWVGIGLTAFPNDGAGEADVDLEETSLTPWSQHFILDGMASGNYGAVDIAMDGVDSQGAWELSSTDAVNGYAGEDYKAIVMQLTTDDIFTWTLSAEIWIEGDSTNMVIVTQTFDGTAMQGAIIEGCTDSNACNYYELATSDNGTCTYPPQYYDCANACLSDTDSDGVCDELEIAGCMSDLACNYDVAATDDDASCVFAEGCETCSGETDGTGTVVDNDADDDGVCDADEIVGCQDVAACNYDSAATDSAACIYVDGICETCSGETDGTGTIVDNDADDDGVCDADEVVGCQDATACNYMTAATDSGACEYATGCEYCSGETDGTGQVLDGDADDDGVCDDDEIAGCQDSTACNYDASATDDDGSCEYCSCGLFTGLSPYTLTLEEHAYDGIPGHTTYRLYVNMDHPNDYLSAIYGEAIPGSTAEPFVLTSTSTPNWHNDPLSNADFAWEHTPFLLATFPDLAYDSWFTFGLEFGPSDDFFTGVGSIDAEGTFWPAFNAGTDVNVSDASGFSIYNVRNCDLPPGSGAGACDANHPAMGGDDGRVLVAQITSEGIVSGEFSVQILQNGNYGAGVYHTEHFAFDGVGTFSSTSWTGAMASNYQDCGCTDATALNYDVDALHDDGGCIPVINGCMESDACNYMDTATVEDGSCVYATGCETCSGETDGTGSIVDNDADDDGVCNADEVAGCQDSTACNYNISATDDGSNCVYAAGCETCSGETDGTGTTVDNDADDDGVCDADEVAGCQDATACNYNAAATDDAANCVYATGCETCSGESDGTGAIVDNDADDDGVCDADEVAACQDATACNYNAAATDEDGSCIYPTGCETCSGATDGTGTTVDNDADDDGVCDADEIPGCQDATACNYNSAATDEDGSCVYATGCETCSGETDGTGTTVDNDADNDGVCDADEVAGCQDPLACNYNISATDADSCTYATETCATCSGETDGTGTVVDNDTDDDGVCDADEIPGCQDATACNFNDAATDEDGSCIYPVGCETCSGETDGTGTTVDNDADNDGVCDADEVAGCQDTTACNYNAAATDDDNSCIYPVGCDTCSGEIDGTGTTVDNDADDDGVCDADEVAGCQDETACNYNSAATDDDGSCLVFDECGVCGGTGIPEGACDCAGNGPEAGYDCDGVCLNDADGDGVCDEFEVVGCTDAGACNYDAAATDPGTCYFAGDYYDCSGNCLNDANGNGTCDEIDALLFNEYAEGVEFGVSQCVGEDFCGEGTVWSDAFQMCVEDTSCPGDLNGDLVVGTGDLLLLLMDYGFECE